LDEAAETNLLKATLWFSTDYLGSMGGLYFSVSIDAETPDDPEAYYRRVMARKMVPSTLVAVGVIENGSSDIIRLAPPYTKFSG
jgi:hypothetical protein